MIARAARPLPDLPLAGLDHGVLAGAHPEQPVDGDKPYEQDDRLNGGDRRTTANLESCLSFHPTSLA